MPIQGSFRLSLPLDKRGGASIGGSLGYNKLLNYDNRTGSSNIVGGQISGSYDFRNKSGGIGLGGYYSGQQMSDVPSHLQPEMQYRVMPIQNTLGLQGGFQFSRLHNGQLKFFPTVNINHQLLSPSVNTYSNLGLNRNRLNFDINANSERY